MFTRLRETLDTAAAAALRTAVRGYRITLGPLLGGHCRHHPTCSQYLLDAVDRHGPWRGAWRGARRVLRCHPLGTAGHDPA